MKLSRFFSLLQLLIFGALLCGCQIGEMSDWAGNLFPPSSDSLYIASVQLTLWPHEATYAADSVAEISGVVFVQNPYGEPLNGREVVFCISDTHVTCVYADSYYQNTTNNNGRVYFTLRTAASGGRVRVGVSCGYPPESAADTVNFLRLDCQPTQLAATVQPETLYTSATHPDTALIRITLRDAKFAPVRNFNVECDQFFVENNFCLRGFIQTDATGIVSDYYTYPYDVTTPFIVTYRVRAGDLRDSVSFTVMPWEGAGG